MAHTSNVRCPPATCAGPRWLAGLSSLLFALAAQADTGPRQHLGLAVWQPGGSLLARDDTVGGDGSRTELGTPFDTRDDLGHAGRGRGWALDYGLRIGQRWQFRVQHQALQTQGRATLQRDLRLSSSRTLNAGEQVSSRMRRDQLLVTFGWRTLDSGAASLTLLAGPTYERFKVSFRRDGDPQGAGDIRAFDGDDAIGGVLGLAGHWSWGERWRAEWEALAGPQDTRIGSARVRWQAHPALSLALGWSGQRARYDHVSCFMGCSALVARYSHHGLLTAVNVHW